MAVAEYLSQLQKDKKALVKNLSEKGVEAQDNETFTTLVPKVAIIETASPIEEQIIIEPNTEHRVYLPAEGYDGIARVEALPVTSDIDINIQSKNIKEGVSILGVTGIYDGVEDLDLQTKTVNPTSEDTGVVVTYDSNYDALGKVIVNPIRASMVKGLTPEIIKKGEKVLEMTGTYGEKSQVKAVYPTTEQQYVYPDEGIKFLEHVIVQPVDRTIDNDIQPKNIKLGVNILGVDGEYTGDFVYQNKTASLNTEKPVTYTADKGYDALESVTVPRVTSAIDPDIKPENIRKGIEILEVVGTYEPAPSMANKNVSPKTYVQTITPDSGYGTMDKVTVGAVTASIDSDIQASNIKSGIEILGVKGTLEYMEPETIYVHPSIERQEILPGEDYNCIDKVVAYPVTSEIDGNIISTNIKEGITILGVEGAYKGETVKLQNKTITPLDTAQEITADDGYDALSTVIVNSPNQYDVEVNPSIEEYTVNKESNRYIKSVIVNPVDSSIDPNIQPGNIRKNMSILGVVGNYEGENASEPIATSIVKGATRESYELSYDLSVGYTHNVPGIIHTLLKIPGNLAVSGTSLDYAFESMDALIEAPLIDTTEVTSMIDMFNGCVNLSEIPIYSTSKVEKFTRCFAACKKITSVPDWDYSSATSTYLMFADCGITQIPQENFMQRFPNITDMSYMFCGCPLSGDLDITLGRPSDHEDNKYIYISQFANEVFDNTHITLDGPCSASGKTAWSYMTRDAIPTGSISTIVDYNENGYFKHFNAISLPTSADTVLRINSNHPERKIDLNLVGTIDTTNIGYYSFNRTAPSSDIYINLPDTGGAYQLCYYCNYLPSIHLYIGPSCTYIGSLFYNCSRLVSILPYEDDAEVIIDGSMMLNIKSAFYGCSSLVNFVGIKDLGKNYTQKTANYANYTLDLSYCTQLSVESLRSIINNLYDLNQNATYMAAGTVYRQSLKLGSTNLAKLTDEEKAVATNKGWNLS